MSDGQPRTTPTIDDGVGGVAATLARFDEPRGSGTTLAVLADTHLTSPSRDSDATIDRSRQHVERALADARRLDVDGVLVAGDLTQCGAPLEHELAATCFENAPGPVLTVPGERDVAPGDPEPYPADWTDVASPDGCPYARRLDGLTVLGVDSATGGDAVPTATHGGAITRAERSWIARTARADPDPAICMTHHPIAPLPTPFAGALDGERHRVRSPERTADALVEAGVELAISGHVRWPTATRYRGLNILGVPSTLAFPPAYLLVHVDARGTTVSLVPLTDWDGMEDAFERARNEGPRGEAVAAAVEDGYFAELPVVEHAPGPSTAPATATPPARRP